MQTRQIGNVESVTEIGLGCWQLGGADWGTISDEAALTILQTAVDRGIRFFDTADVYGGGRSESLIGKFLKQCDANIFVASKVGRRNFPGPYTSETLREHITESTERLGVDALDLVQLHCIPPDVMAAGEVFDCLREFKRKGLIKNFGASVESVDEALSILHQPELTSLQIIFNVFRQKPIEQLLAAAVERSVGIIARLPLASGLLAGKFSAATTFAETDHRHYNRDGEAFNVGETFAGLPLYTGISLADQLKPMVTAGMTMAQFAQRWILDHKAVSTVITGASRPDQVSDNAAVSKLPPLGDAKHQSLSNFYHESVHEHIRGVY